MWLSDHLLLLWSFWPQSAVSAPQTITYDSAWTPMKRLASVVEQTAEETTMAEDGA